MSDSLAGILRSGLAPSLGAGAEALTRRYGVEVPCVYLAQALAVATQYPIYNSSIKDVELSGSTCSNGLPGGDPRGGRRDVAASRCGALRGAQRRAGHPAKRRNEAAHIAATGGRGRAEAQGMVEWRGVDH